MQEKEAVKNEAPFDVPGIDQLLAYRRWKITKMGAGTAGILRQLPLPQLRSMQCGTACRLIFLCRMTDGGRSVSTIELHSTQLQRLNFFPDSAALSMTRGLCGYSSMTYRHNSSSFCIKVDRTRSSKGRATRLLQVYDEVDAYNECKRSLYCTSPQIQQHNV